MSIATLAHWQLYIEAQAAAQAATSWLGSTTAIYDLETRIGRDVRTSIGSTNQHPICMGTDQSMSHSAYAYGLALQRHGGDGWHATWKNRF